MTETIMPRTETEVTSSSHNWEKLKSLEGWHIIVMDQFAGLGHLRIGTELIDGARQMGCPKDQIEHVVIDDLLAGKVHGPGSNVAALKFATEFLQSHDEFQRMIGMFYHLAVIRSDQEAVRQALREQIVRQNLKKVVIVISHPDLATVMNDSKEHLEKELGIEIFLVVLLPDHLPERGQFPYYTLNADLIAAPDDGSKRVAKKEVDKWYRINRSTLAVIDKLKGIMPWLPSLFFNKVDVRPDVEVVPHSTHHSLRRELTEAQMLDRLSQVNPYGDKPLRVFIPMGGSAPNKNLLSRLATILPDKNWIPKVLVGQKPSTKDFIEVLRGNGVAVQALPTNEQQIAAFNQTFPEMNPAVVITKPSELTSLTQLKPYQMGGSIVVFNKPIGDQERQNLGWVRQRDMMPDQLDQERLEHLLLDGKEKHLEYLLERAHGWRAIALPEKKLTESDGEHAVRCAQFLEQARRRGIFTAMLQYVPSEKTQVPENDDHGDELFWEMIAEYLTPSASAH